jgi:transposase-like protein
MPEQECRTERQEAASIDEVNDLIERTAREGAQRMLQAALEQEVKDHLARYAHFQTEEGRRQVVANGHAPERTILTGVGPLRLARPRVDERKASGAKEYEPFSSTILPRFLRRTPTLEGALATLYLKGISTNDFPVALEAILGEKAQGLSASTISRLKAVWEREYEAWRKRPLGSTQYAYVWADGVYFNVRLEDQRSCVLVLIGANFKGEKELLGIRDGYRESEQSWKELLLEAKDRGLEIDPKLATADGGLGFWKALPQVYPMTRAQRCWVHKTANILDKLPRGMQGRAKAMIYDIYRAESKDSALKAYAQFQKAFQDKYPEAVGCLRKDEESLFTFYDFPAAHWLHIRSTNVIESVFATVRLRTEKTKGCGTRLATLTMVFKLMQEAQKSWRRLDDWEKLTLVLEGRRFVDGVLQEDAVA